MSLMKVISRTSKDIEKMAAALGLEIFEIKCSNMFLGITADRCESHITLDECAALSRKIAEFLDEYEAEINGEYALEVTSPGMYRPLLKARHYEQSIGKQIRIVTKVDGKKRRYTGVLESFDGKCVRMTLKDTAEMVEWSIEHILQAQLNPNNA